MRVTARCFRSAILVASAALVLLVPATAGAQVSSLSVTVGHLQAQGTEVPVQVDFQCDPGFDFAFVDASLIQVSGHKLAQGSGAFFPAEDLPCESSPFSVEFTVTASGAFAFKEGNAMASVEVVVFDPTTDNFFGDTFTQTTRLTKK